MSFEHTVARRTGLITIGIPTRNRSRMLIRAVQSALSQTYGDLEIVVSDNASDDDTHEQLEAIRDGRLVCLRQPADIGMVGNFNACLSAATGELFLMLSDDDVLEHDAIERLSRPFLEHSKSISPGDIGVSWCPCTIIDAEGGELWRTVSGPALESPASLLVGLFDGRRGPRFSSVMVRTADALAAGGYDEARYGAVSDIANWGQAALGYRYAACIDAHLVRYTNHVQSETSKSKIEDWRKWADAMHAELCRTVPQHATAEECLQLERSRSNLLANITLTVLIQILGRRAAQTTALREIWSSRAYVLNPLIMRRLALESWKLLRLRRPERRDRFRSSGSAVRNACVRLARHIPPDQVGRYLLVGMWNTVFGYSSFALLVALLDPLIPHGYIVAMVVSSLINITVSFLGYKWFVFRTKGRYWREWTRCVAVYSGGIIVGAVALPVVVETLRHGAGLRRSAPYVGGAMLMAFGIVYNFFGHKKFSFRS